MDLKNVLENLTEHRSRIDAAIDALSGTQIHGRSKPGNGRRKGKRRLSAAAKKRISEAAKGRWAKAKKAGKNRL